LIGLFIGLAGVAVLVSGGFSGGSGSAAMNWIGAGVVIVAAIAWAGGSVYSIRRPIEASAPLASGMQMLAGGTLLIVVGLVTGEYRKLHFNQASWLSIGAFIYLIVFGSIIAFTAYSWLLREVSPARAATYAYVNPVVAVLLGWFIASEPVTVRMLLAAVVIVASVALITTYGKEGAKKSDAHTSLSDEEAAAG
jgi:drug/metabolite transporter (DMT)-like permease